MCLVCALSCMIQCASTSPTGAGRLAHNSSPKPPSTHMTKREA
jgi:hypothetical protein